MKIEIIENYAIDTNKIFIDDVLFKSVTLFHGHEYMNLDMYVKNYIEGSNILEISQDDDENMALILKLETYSEYSIKGLTDYNKYGMSTTPRDEFLIKLVKFELNGKLMFAYSEAIIDTTSVGVRYYAADNLIKQINHDEVIDKVKEFLDAVC